MQAIQLVTTRKQVFLTPFVPGLLKSSVNKRLRGFQTIVHLQVWLHDKILSSLWDPSMADNYSQNKAEFGSVKK